MWEKAARRRAWYLGLALFAGYTIVTSVVFSSHADSSQSPAHVRDASDWLRTIGIFTPLFGAMHVLSVYAYHWQVGSYGDTKKTSAHWFASHCVSMGHAIVVTAAGLYGLGLLWDAPAAIKLGSRAQSVPVEWLARYAYVAVSGELFTAWLIYDAITVVCAWSVLGSWETLAHHAAFLGASYVMRGYYMAPWQAAVCMCMEASTPFLNVCQLKEAFGLTKEALVVKGSFVSFAFFFAVFRVVLLPAATLQMVLNFGVGPWSEGERANLATLADAAPPEVPVWAGVVLVSLLLAACGLMFMWFRRIVAILLAPASAQGEGQSLPMTDGDSEEPPSPTSQPMRSFSDDEESALVNV